MNDAALDPLGYLRFGPSDFIVVVKQQTVHLASKIHKLAYEQLIAFVLESSWQSLPGTVMENMRSWEIGQIKSALLMSLENIGVRISTVLYFV